MVTMKISLLQLEKCLFQSCKRNYTIVKLPFTELYSVITEVLKKGSIALAGQLFRVHLCVRS